MAAVKLPSLFYASKRLTERVPVRACHCGHGAQRPLPHGAPRVGVVAASARRRHPVAADGVGVLPLRLHHQPCRRVARAAEGPAAPAAAAAEAQWNPRPRASSQWHAHHRRRRLRALTSRQVSAAATAGSGSGSSSGSSSRSSSGSGEAEQDSVAFVTKPSPLLTAYEAVVAQLEALKVVYHPDGDLHADHGLEVLYSFAAIDPFDKGSTYFGERLNVAYYSQFSSKFSLRPFRALLGMQRYRIVSALYLSQDRFVARVHVSGSGDASSAVYLFDMEKKDFGHLKGCWVTLSLRRDHDDTNSSSSARSVGRGTLPHQQC